MKNKKLFRVHARTETDAPKAKIFEALLNAPRFREALLREFEEKAQEMARRVIGEAMGMVEGHNS